MPLFIHSFSSYVHLPSVSENKERENNKNEKVFKEQQPKKKVMI